MDGIRFDDLARALTAALPRRGLLALAALALPGAAAEAGKPRPTKPKRCKPRCGACQKCVKGKCTADPAKNGAACANGTCQAGACACPAGAWSADFCPAGQCCPQGQACSGTGCRACPALPDFCAAASLVGCGATGDPENPFCACVTSVQGTTACSPLLGGCIACTTDAQCTTQLGVPGLCIDVSGGCTGCETSTICVVAGCEAASGAGRRTGGRGRDLRRFERRVG